jgi:prephenate dehydratase
MAAHLPDAEYLPGASTAAAAAGLAGERPAYQAAVCAPGAAEDHGLTVLQEDIGDNNGAVTRFVLVARPGRLPAPTGADKTSVVLFQREDRPGGLLELLEQFATRGINLTRIESRPTGGRLGDYCFSIDCEGHVNNERVGETLMGLQRVCSEVRFLGSYPRADGVAAVVSIGTGDKEFVDARAWLKSLRNPGRS